MRFCHCGQPVFGTDKNTRIGYCKSHQWMRTDIDKRSITQKAMSKSAASKQKTDIRKLITNENEAAVALVEYYRDAAKELEKHPYCENCHAYIPKKFFRAATAHIFPKSLFPSVAANKHNRLFLGAGCCHGKSHTIETFSKMKIFPVAIEKFYLFEKEIKENHKYLSLFKEAILNYKNNHNATSN